MTRETWSEGAEVRAGVRVFRNALLAASHVRDLVLADPRGPIPYVMLPYVCPPEADLQGVLWFAGPLDQIAGAVVRRGELVEAEDAP